MSPSLLPTDAITTDPAPTRAAGARATLARAAARTRALPVGDLRTWLMTGVSYVIPLIVTGGLLIALGYALGGQSVRTAPPVTESFSPFSTASWAGLTFQLGTAAFTLIVPAVAAAIAFAMAGRPALVPGVVGGLAAAAAGAGYLGGIAAGLLAGATVVLAERLRPPPSLRTAWYVVLLPLVATLVTGAVMVLVLGGPLGALAAAVTGWLTVLSTGDAVATGLVIGALVGIDLGGPVNKAVYGFAVTALAAGIPGAPTTMAAVMAAGMVPPLAMALATTVRRQLFTPAERAAGRAAWITGAVFVTEGAIPFAASDPLRVIPSIVAGSAVSGCLVMTVGAAVTAPHGGVLVLPLVSNLLGFLAALAAGVAVATGLVLLLRTRTGRGA